MTRSSGAVQCAGRGIIRRLVHIQRQTSIKFPNFSLFLETVSRLLFKGLSHTVAFYDFFIIIIGLW